jgi:energy-coupling factor transporter ATP-binding protein EcfA2
MENPERVTYFAATDSRGKYVPFGIKTKDRDRHMYVIGKTGMGKSTLLENMAIQDIRNGEGLAFIDPHGGTVERLLEYIPESRINDVVYFAPFDLDHPIAFNVMEDVGYDRRHLVVSGLMATFKKIWEDAWSARMEYILTNTLLALLEYPGATLLGVNRMYTDKEYRKKVVENIKDPVVKDFWTKEFATYTDRYTQEATPAIQNKIGQFTGNPLIRNIVGQPKSSFDIRTMMDEKKILLINLSKGLIGETNMNLLGSMLTTRLFLAAMSRANLPAEELAKHPPFYFYVDEFQNFANKTFAEILSESRKYKLNLIITHQYIEQMEEEVRDAVFGNVGTTVVFRVGPFDAEVLETLFAPRFTKEDIVILDKRQIYLTLMIDGVGSVPFSAVTIPPIEPPPISHKEAVKEASRQHYTAPRAGIEGAIAAEFTPPAVLQAEPKREERPRPPRREPVREERHPPKPKQEHPPRHESKPELKHPIPQPVDRPAPQKSPDDLRSILRTLADKHAGEKQKKEVVHKQELKGTLSHVLAEPSQKPNSPATVPEPIAQPYEVPEASLRDVLKG